MTTAKIELIVSCATLGSGGAERVLSILSPFFASLFNEVTFVLWKRSEIFYTIDERISIINLEDSDATNDIAKMIKFRKLMKVHPHAIILSFLYPYSIRALLSSLFISRRIIVAERRQGNKVKGGRLIKLLRDLLYLKASDILLQTESNKRNYPFWLKKRIQIIENPMSLDRHIIGCALGVKKRDTIVSVGRLIPEKNHKFLIEAFSVFVKTHPNFDLYIYGEGPLRNKLERLIHDLNLQGKVILPGNTKNVLECIAPCKAFVLPSLTEGMPNALCEAMSIGLPCISTKVNGAIDFIDDRINGILIDNYSCEQLTEALSEVCDNSALSYSLGLQAKKIYERFNYDSICTKWKKVLLRKA